MKTMTSRSVRFAFVTFLMAMTTFAAVESAVGARGEDAGKVAEGLSTCGSESQPCRLPTLAVEAKAAEPAPVQLAEGLAECGTQDQPCRLEAVQVNAQAQGGLLASTERTVGMTLRVRS